MKFKFSKKGILIFLAIVVLFLVLRLPALHQPYHQDEYKWVSFFGSGEESVGVIPHPPLAEFVYSKLGPVVGENNFRAIPLIFSLLNLLLLFYLAKIIFDYRTAYGTILLFTVSFFSVLASLMVDVDGAVMPFFLLLLSIGYFKIREVRDCLPAGKAGKLEIKEKWPWLVLLLVGALGGFLVKVSAVLPLLAFALDWAVEQGAFRNKQRLFAYGLKIILAAAVLINVLLISKLFFPFFNVSSAIKYWEHFADSSSFLNRGWLQTFIQFSKAVLYSSPLLLAPVIFTNQVLFRKLRPFYLFIFAGLVFYLVLFDFSIGALDRYLQFLIIPLCLIGGAIGVKVLDQGLIHRFKILIISLAASLIFLIQFLPQNVSPLYPKTEWLQLLVSFHWNFLFPFTGGSGPLPFYISFAFIGLMWLFVLILVLIAFVKVNLKTTVLLGILILGLVYNGVFIEEYLFGGINGNAAKLVVNATAFIKADQDIKMVTVYNDNGGYNVIQTGKYRKRLYIDPKFDVTEKLKTLNKYREHYLVVDIPHIDPNSVYAQYFNSCQVAYREQDKYISSTIYDCRKD